MRSYTETHTKSKCDIFSLREVKRDITQHRDGTIKTMETEIIKEQAFVQQEQIQREFIVAKDLYLNRKMEQLNQQLNNCKNPSVHKRKIMYDRTQSICIMDAANDLPLLLNNSFEATLHAEHEALRYSCWELPDDVQLFHGKSEQSKLSRRVKTHRQRFSHGVFDDEAYGSRYFTMSLQKLRKDRTLQQRANRMLYKLAQDEQKRAHQTPVHITEISPGVLRRGPVPLFPFSDRDIQLANEQEINQRYINTDYYADYIGSALDSNGQDPDLVTPALSQLLTAQILNQKSAPPTLVWPELLKVTGIEDKSLHRLPFTPCLFWGKSTTEKESFVCCRFRIGEIIYENVWMEFPVMCFSTAYGQTTARVGYDMTMGREKRDLSLIGDVQDLLSIDPDCVEFSKLQKLQSNMNEMIEQQEKVAFLSQKKHELCSTIHKLQMKSRRV